MNLCLAAGETWGTIIFVVKADRAAQLLPVVYLQGARFGLLKLRRIRLRVVRNELKVRHRSMRCAQSVQKHAFSFFSKNWNWLLDVC